MRWCGRICRWGGWTATRMRYTCLPGWCWGTCPTTCPGPSLTSLLPCRAGFPLHCRATSATSASLRAPCRSALLSPHSHPCSFACTPSQGTELLSSRRRAASLAFWCTLLYSQALAHAMSQLKNAHLLIILQRFPVNTWPCHTHVFDPPTFFLQHSVSFTIL